MPPLAVPQLIRVSVWRHGWWGGRVAGRLRARPAPRVQTLTCARIREAYFCADLHALWHILADICSCACMHGLLCICCARSVLVCVPCRELDCMRVSLPSRTRWRAPHRVTWNAPRRHHRRCRRKRRPQRCALRRISASSARQKTSSGAASALRAKPFKPETSGH